jgi:hypothetical protein
LFVGKRLWAFFNLKSRTSQMAATLNKLGKVCKNLINLTSNYTTFEGEGKGKNPDWKPEKSLLILDISKGEDSTIGKHLKQTAIVFGKKVSEAKLLLV